MTIRKTSPFIPMILGLSLAGCSFQNTLSLGVDDPCASLKGIIADYPSGFEGYRGSASNFNSVTVYGANEQIIRGHCEIWSWANNDSAYVCSANAPNEEVALARYDTAIKSVEQCLGGSWNGQERERTRNGQPAGMATTFQTPGSNQPNVSVHRVSLRDSSSVYVYVGTPARIAAY